MDLGNTPKIYRNWGGTDSGLDFDLSNLEAGYERSVRINFTLAFNDLPFFCAGTRASFLWLPRTHKVIYLFYIPTDDGTLDKFSISRL